MKKAALHNLGCKVNAYETEAMQQMLEDDGYEIVSFSEPADVYIINTCSVTNMADAKSRQMIHKARKLNPNAIVAAVGCYVQTAAQNVIDDLAVDIVLGNNKKTQLVSAIHAFENGHEKVANVEEDDQQLSYEQLRVRKTAEHIRAFIKVQDGCNQFCSYCIIPYARGRIRSRELTDVVEEVTTLAAEGFQEVVLTGIHLSSYGMTSYNNEIKNVEEQGAATPLLNLISAVAAVDGIERIRLGSLEPRLITEAFAEELAKIEKICPHFHLSLQSGCDATLQRMNRKYSIDEYRTGVERLRKYFNDPAITTDVIVGFPGETEEEFAQSKAFLEEIRFYEMHIFKYSKRKGTVAEVMPNQIPEQIKHERSKELIALGAEMSKEYRDRQMGCNTTGLMESKTTINGKEYWTGFTKEYVRVAIPVEDDTDMSNTFVRGTVSAELGKDTYLLVK